MLQSLFPKENFNTTTLNPISTRKLESEPIPTRSDIITREPERTRFPGRVRVQVGTPLLHTQQYSSFSFIISFCKY